MIQAQGQFHDLGFEVFQFHNFHLLASKAEGQKEARMTETFLGGQMGLNKNKMPSEEVGELEIKVVCRAKGYTGVCVLERRVSKLFKYFNKNVRTPWLYF